MKRRKALGNKRNDISEEDIAEITKIYGDFKESEISQIYDNEDFGYTKITVERPLRDEEGNLVLKKGKKQPDTSLRDTENVPLKRTSKSTLKEKCYLSHRMHGLMRKSQRWDMRFRLRDISISMKPQDHLQR